MPDTKTLDRAKVQHVAKLASLSLTDAEADKFTRELAAIVGYVEELNTLDTDDVPPTAQVPTAGAAAGEDIQPPGTRADEVRPGLSREEALAGAPRVEHDGFAVPTFVES